MRHVRLLRASLFLAVTALFFVGKAQSSAPVEVFGYFCGDKTDQVSFLQHRASGESEEVAANFVNKSAGKLSCAYFMTAEAIPEHDETLMQDGVTYAVKGYLFLPEKVER